MPGDSAVRIPFASASKTASYKAGYVGIAKLPLGDYTVFISDVVSARVSVHVSAGADFGCRLGDYVLSHSRILQLSPDTHRRSRRCSRPRTAMTWR